MMQWNDQTDDEGHSHENTNVKIFYDYFKH